MNDKAQAVLVNVFTNQHFSLNRTQTVIGRSSSNDIVLKDILVSREHAIIHCQNDDYYVEDKESTNGTMHNNNFVLQRARLVPGDRIRIGTTWFSFAFTTDSDDRVSTEQLSARQLTRTAKSAGPAQAAVCEFKAMIAQYRKRFMTAH